MAKESRGSLIEEFVEAVDILPTIIEFAGGTVCKQRVEGKSLLSFTRGIDRLENPREYTISQIDYSDRGPRDTLNLNPYDCRAHMIRNYEWKYILHEKFRPQLYDMKNDPEELFDLGDSPDHASVRDEMHEKMFTWFRNRLIRTEMDYDSLYEMGLERDEKMGILIGHW